MHPRADSILVTFDDGHVALIGPHIDEQKVFEYYDKYGIKYQTDNLTPEEAFEWLKANVEGNSEEYV